MWADTLLALERGHLLRLTVWGACSVVLGTAVLLAIKYSRRQHDVPLLRHFAIQTAAWGAVILAIVLWARQSLALRDYIGARQLVTTLWLNTGLDAGYVAVGLTLVITAWRWGARLGAIGAGLGVMLQGGVLLLLDLLLILRIGPVQ